MEIIANKPWKNYVDDWNSDIYNKDSENKRNTDVTIMVNTLELSEEDNTTSNSALSLDDLSILISDRNFVGKTDLINLDHATKVINWCIGNTDINELNYQYFMSCVTWICDCIMYFITELKIPLITNKQVYGLVRSSYKLCPQKSNCIYQYPDTGCNATFCKFQHYPYANLLLDCTSIVNYITEHFDKSNSNSTNTKTSKFIATIASNSSQSEEFNTQELQRCLTTINYVFMIMYRELETIEKCRKNEANYDIRRYHAYHMIYRPSVNNKRRDRK